MSHHVAVRLPDGRQAVADYRQPIVHVMRRVNARLSDDPGNSKGRGPGCPADVADCELIAEWLDNCEPLSCPADIVYGVNPDPTCGGRHEPASPAAYEPPRYRRPVTGGLW